MTWTEGQYPLIHCDSPDQILVYCPDGAISVARFIAEARQLAEQLQEGRHVLNMCQDRYRFMVGLAATILAGKISLLPSTYTEETLRQLYAAFPDTLCLHDHEHWPHPYPNLAYPGKAPPATLAEPVEEIPLIDAGQRVAYVFTSGSTGNPTPHPKTWGKLVRNSRTAARELGLDRQPMSIVGTVPPQHMFGFESMVLLCLQGRCPLWSGKPFYPADIVAALDAVPEPRMLVTTPFHQQSLLDASLATPSIAQLLLATAPLSVELANRSERTLNAPLLEIYGSTETGQIATRRPVESPAWKLFPGIQLQPAAHSNDVEEGSHIASGGHIEQAVPLSDRLSLEPDGRFLLWGRIADQVNIAGKRSSLSFLTAQLKAIPGVEDGIFFQPLSDDDQAITRLCALVAAPDLALRDIQQALRERLDPAFLPRPLIRVSALPYNDTGKLPRTRLQAVLDRYRSDGES